MRFSSGLQPNPVIKRSPEALVILLHDFDTSASTLATVAARWATSVPAAAFVALDGLGALDSFTPSLPSHTTLDPDANVEALPLDRMTRHLEPLLWAQLHSYRLDAGRLVLVGFGHGGTLALHMVLRRGLGCAGVLAFGAEVMRPLPRIVRVDQKLRLIAFAGKGDIDHRSLREVVALLTAYGIDTRAALLPGAAALSDAAIRHAGVYLAELVATARGSKSSSSERTAMPGSSSAPRRHGLFRGRSP